MDFLDVAMHEAGMEFRLEDVTVRSGSPLVGQTVRDAQAREGGDALLLALRSPTGTFVTNPPAEQVLSAAGTMP